MPDPSEIRGTWALQPVNGANGLTIQQPMIEAALDFADVKGFCLRYLWKKAHDDILLIKQAKAIATNKGKAFTMRFVAGRHTPQAVFDAGAAYYTRTGSTVKIPKPFTNAGTPGNAVFEQYYEAHVARIAKYARLNGIKIIHLPWYGWDGEELDIDSDVQAASGYSQDAWLRGHKRLVGIAAKYAGPDLAVEFALTGEVAAYPTAPDLLADHIIVKMGEWSLKAYVQGNRLGLSTAKPTTKLLHHGMQMADETDYDWPAVYSTLRTNSSVYVEVYCRSFGLANRASLQTEITRFATGTAAIKPPIQGLYHRTDWPTNATARAHLSGFVLNVGWDEVQATEGGPILANNPIDVALGQIRGDANGLRMKVRMGLAGGEDHPAWLIAKVGQVHMYEPVDSARWPDGMDITIWWKPEYRAAYADLMTKLAAKYDAVPEILDWVISANRTFYMEPFIRQAADSRNGPVVVAAGYTVEKDKAQLLAAIDLHAAVFKSTRSSLAFSAYQWYDANGVGKTEGVSSTSFAGTTMVYMRQKLGNRAVLGNNSLDYPTSPVQPAVVSHGPPIYFQTQKSDKVHLEDALNWAKDNKVNAVELPGGYPYTSTEDGVQELTDAEMDTYDAALRANPYP